MVVCDWLPLGHIQKSSESLRGNPCILAKDTEFIMSFMEAPKRNERSWPLTRRCPSAGGDNVTLAGLQTDELQWRTRTFCSTLVRKTYSAPSISYHHHHHRHHLHSTLGVRAKKKKKKS
jgi:hypothetical protein